MNVPGGRGHSHVDVFASHCGNGTDRFDHMADDVDDGQVDDGPAGEKAEVTPNSDQSVRSESSSEASA